MKVILFNDTGNSCHAGCQAVSDAHARLLGAAGHRVIHREFVLHHRKHWTGDADSAIKAVLSDDSLVKKISAADAVIVNGEGTLHHNRGYHLLAILGAAQELGKPTLLVNAVFQETAGFDEVLRRLIDFTVRDNRSLQHAKDRDLPCRLVWDSSLAAEYSPMPLKDFKDKALVTDWHLERADDVGRAMLSYLSAEPDNSFFLPFLTEAAFSLWRRFPATMATANVIISGRHHGNYFAIKSGTPFVCLPSNTFKVEGLVDMLGEQVPVVKDIKSLRDGIEYVTARPEMFKRIQAKVKEQHPLSTFSELGKGQDSDVPTELKRLKKDLTKARRVMRKRHIAPFIAADRVLKAALLN